MSQIKRDIVWDGNKYIRMSSIEKSIKERGDSTSLVNKAGNMFEDPRVNEKIDMTMPFSIIIGIAAFYYLFIRRN